MIGNATWSRWSLVPAVVLTTCPAAMAQRAIPEESKIGGFAIGCQAYTFNRFTAFEAIEKTALAGGKVIEFYPGQSLSPEQPDLKVGHEAPAEVVAILKSKLEEHGIEAVNYGVVGVPEDEQGARKVFEFARAMGLRAITTESVDAIDTLEKLAREYDVAVAFHNHPRRPDDPDYKVWDPKFVADLVEGRDPLIGACADTGHWARSGLEPVECLRILEGRVISAHLKDLDEMGPRGHDVPFGTGACDIRAVLDELEAQGFEGNLSIEYEHDWENNVPAVGQCIGFVRGYAAD
ncbi:sugar phosphate isomerase/epimerase family protein [Tautonia plasticadhaerens]|uniref:Xylose isomerase-like TIM barrel n=1 Tax=Tautonia plasticadhaerens TaxID=2527974 RepID=A0A518GYV0_9BACT|nr:sugar phosphate isomerase/epimerase [Tautonia plasticadhaerens]QDV33776.1 Xylose isomerase-like TIM barrel [Tautonia plasticadhaerens]